MLDVFHRLPKLAPKFLETNGTERPGERLVILMCRVHIAARVC